MRKYLHYAIILICLFLISCTDGIFPSYQSMLIVNKTGNELEFKSFGGGEKIDKLSFTLQSRESYEYVGNLKMGDVFVNFFSPYYDTIYRIDSLIIEVDSDETYYIFCDIFPSGDFCYSSIPEFDFFLSQHRVKLDPLEKPVRVNGKRVSRRIIFEIKDSDIEGLREYKKRINQSN